MIYHYLTDLSDTAIEIWEIDALDDSNGKLVAIISGIDKVHETIAKSIVDVLQKHQNQAVFS